jgi:hypothetical protein
VESFEELPDKFDRIFFGDEGCDLFLYDSEFQERINHFLLSGTPIGLIAPFLTPESEQPFRNLLGNLRLPIEVVVNDIGAYKIARESLHKPILGRLLSRQASDPEIIRFCKPQPDRIVYYDRTPARLRYSPPHTTLMERFRDSPLFSDEAAEVFLGDYPEMQVMCDMLPHGIPDSLPPKYSIMLHLEEVLVSMLPCQHNCRDCPQKEVKIGETRSRNPIYRKRNTCYYKFSEINGSLELDAFPPSITRTLIKA